MRDYLVIRLTARCRTERGASAVEYGLLVASVAVMGFAAFKLVDLLSAVFQAESSKAAVPNNGN